jgi:hypothetical protein
LLHKGATTSTHRHTDTGTKHIHRHAPCQIQSLPRGLAMGQCSTTAACMARALPTVSHASTGLPHTELSPTPCTRAPARAHPGTQTQPHRHRHTPSDPESIAGPGHGLASVRPLHAWPGLCLLPLWTRHSPSYGHIYTQPSSQQPPTSASRNYSVLPSRPSPSHSSHTHTHHTQGHAACQLRPCLSPSTHRPAAAIKAPPCCREPQASQATHSAAFSRRTALPACVLGVPGRRKAGRAWWV